MTVDRLREKHRAAKLSATGTKKTLTDRLAAHLSKSGPSSSHPRRSQRQSASSRDHQQNDNNPSKSNQHSSNGDHQRDSPGTSSSQHRQVRYRPSRQRDSPINSSLYPGQPRHGRRHVSRQRDSILAVETHVARIISTINMLGSVHAQPESDLPQQTRSRRDTLAPGGAWPTYMPTIVGRRAHEKGSTTTKSDHEVAAAARTPPLRVPQLHPIPVSSQVHGRNVTATTNDARQRSQHLWEPSWRSSLYLATLPYRTDTLPG